MTETRVLLSRISTSADQDRIQRQGRLPAVCAALQQASMLREGFVLQCSALNALHNACLMLRSCLLEIPSDF